MLCFVFSILGLRPDAHDACRVESVGAVHAVMVEIARSACRGRPDKPASYFFLWPCFYLLSQVYLFRLRRVLFVCRRCM